MEYKTPCTTIQNKKDWVKPKLIFNADEEIFLTKQWDYLERRFGLIFRCYFLQQASKHIVWQTPSKIWKGNFDSESNLPQYCYVQNFLTMLKFLARGLVQVWASKDWQLCLITGYHKII